MQHSLLGHRAGRSPKGASRTIRLDKGKIVSAEDLSAAPLLMVITGLVKLSGQAPGGPPRTIGFYFPGEVISLGLDETALRLEVKALQAASLQAISPDVLAQGSKPGAKSSAALFERLCRQLTMEQQARLTVTSRHINTRVAAFLLDLVERSGGLRVPRPVVQLPMRRCDIADYLGIRVETLSRLLTSWKTMGVIRLPTPREAVVLDRAYLEALVSGEDTPAR